MAKKNIRKGKKPMINWKEESYFPTKLKEEMKSMWEIPQICQFLHFTKDIFNVPNVTIYEMERMLLIPKASKQLANIMTCLLSSPNKTKTNKIPPMPYVFWTNILTHKINNWFKHYHIKHMDVIKVLETIGVEPEFWNIFPDQSLFAEKDFEDLSFKQRVWLLKTLCDTLMHSRKTIQEKINNHPWEEQEEMILGTDSHGAKYIYFPQFVNTELRIYKHCTNNTILSTAEPVKPESEVKVTVNNSLPSNGKVKKKFKKRNRWKKGYSSRQRKKDKSGKSAGKKDNNQFYTCNCSNSFIINDELKMLEIKNDISKEDLHSSFTSSNNNNSISNDSNSNNSNDSNINNSKDSNINNNNNNNNNDISSNNIDNNQMRSPSKMSDESTISTSTKCSYTKSSGYDTNVSSESQQSTDENVNTNTFKGFSIPADENDDIIIINQLLNKLKTEIDMKYGNPDVTTENATDEATDAESITLIYDETIQDDNKESISIESNLNRCNLDNLSNNSKTDDEKLNEIIVTGNTISTDKLSTNSDDITDLDSLSSISKSDDEKLSETEISLTDMINNISNDVPDTSNKSKNKKRKRSNNRDINNAYKKLNLSNESVLEPDETQNCIRSGTNFCMERNSSFDNNDDDVSDEKQLTDITQITDMIYNTKQIKNNSETENENVSFNIMLSKLGVSNFQLIVDSVETLRELISSFSSNVAETIPSSEELLINKLKELLEYVEKNETVLKDTTRKAKAKLLKEWTNFQIGRQAAVCCSSMEDQDSTVESGVSSNNWWILGSQDNELSTANDESTLQTLPNSTLSPISTESCNNQSSKIKNEKQCANREKEECEKSKDEEPNGKSGNAEQGGGENDEETTEQNYQKDEECNRNKEGEQQPQRVLRTRGISSYTEQFYLYDEIDESELGEWTDIKTIYASPSAQVSTSSSNSPPKNRHNNNWSEKEDSDQDWILPGSRKRKNKRSLVSNKKLKSLQLKNMDKKTIQFENVNKQGTSNHNKNNKADRNKKNRKRERKKSLLSTSKAIKYPQIQMNSVRTVSSVEAAKIGYVDSIHSELDIKDETPNLNSASNKTNRTVPEIGYLVQQNPTLIGIAQQNSFVPRLVQQNYYMQKVQPEYVVYKQPTNFLPIQSVPCIVTSQPIVNHPSYILNTTQTQMKNVQSVPNISITKNTEMNESTLQSNSYRILKPNTVQQSPLNLTLQQNANNINKLDTDKSKNKTTSLIILSDSDDEIEILNEKISDDKNEKGKPTSDQTLNITPVAGGSTLKNIIPQEIMQRIHQGCISITPIKPVQTQSTSTQLVVVVNETGSYYALALPNGSKLILTPEQVAQIRASNGGKLVL